MEFTLKIKLGNDAMQTLDDIIESLRQSRESLADGYMPLGKRDRDTLRDGNGNFVGQWEVK